MPEMQWGLVFHNFFSEKYRLHLIGAFFSPCSGLTHLKACLLKT
jgi:hypothetical protein